MNIHDGIRKETRTRFIEGEGYLVEEVEAGTPVMQGQTVLPSVPAAPPQPVIITVADVSLSLAKQVVEANGLMVVPSSFLNEQQLEDLKVDVDTIKKAAEAGDPPPAKVEKLNATQAIAAVKAAASFDELNTLTRSETRVTVLNAAEERAAELKEAGAQ